MVVRVIHAALSLNLIVKHRRGVGAVLIVGLVYDWLFLDRVQCTSLGDHLLLVSNWVSMESFPRFLIYQTQLRPHELLVILLMALLNLVESTR